MILLYLYVFQYIQYIYVHVTVSPKHIQYNQTQHNATINKTLCSRKIIEQTKTTNNNVNNSLPNIMPKTVRVRVTHKIKFHSKTFDSDFDLL